MAEGWTLDEFAAPAAAAPPSASAPEEGWSLEDFAKPAAAPTPKEAPGMVERAGAAVSGAYSRLTDSHEKHGIATNAAAGATDTVAKVLGFPVDATARAIVPTLWNSLPDDRKTAIRAEHPADAAVMDAWSSFANKANDHPVGGSDFFKKVLGAVGANPDDVKATTPGEHIARAAGEGAASMAVPGAALARPVSAVKSLGATLGDILGAQTIDGSIGAFIRGTMGNLAIGGASGAGSEVAADHVPDELKPTAHLLGGAAGALGAAGIIAGAGATAGPVVRSAIEAASEPAELRAARAISSKASDPAAFRTALDNQSGSADLVEGSKPTTFQAAGDLGIGAHERTIAASPGGVAPFAERRVEQNTARLDALGDVADPAADSAAVSDYVRSRLQELTNFHAGKVATAAKGVADTLAKAGGDAFDNPAAYGEALRGPLSGLHQEAKDAASGLWRAIDPDMSAPVSVGPLKQAAADLLDTLPKVAKQPEGEEASILAGIHGLDDTTDFGSMVALRTRLTDAMRDERRNGSPTVLRRLAIVLDNVDGTLAKTAGEIAADPTQRAGVISDLKSEAATWESNEQRAGIAAGAGAGGGNRDVAPREAGSVPAALGGQGQAGGQLAVPAGDQGVQEVAGIAPEVAARYAAARGATKELKGTYESGPVGAVLAPGAQRGSFKTTASNVAKGLFDNPEKLQAFVDAAKDNPEALAPMRDYAAFSLRQAAVKDGILSPAAYQKWMGGHAYALRQFPDLAPKFADVKAAQATLDASLADQKAALVNYQTGAAKAFLKDQKPEDAVASVIKNPEAFSELVAAMKDSPPALAGLKRATVDLMMSKAQSTAEAGTSELPQINAATLQKFFFQNRAALSKLFDEKELANIANVTADLQRANRSIVAVKIPGGSNTAQDTGSRGLSILQDVLQKYGGKAVGVAAGQTAAGPVGAGAGFIIGAAADALVSARSKSIQDAITEMMLNPEMARAWLAKVPASSGESAAKGFARQLRAVTANQVVRAINDEVSR